MTTTVEQKFLALRPDETRCPARVRQMAPEAELIHVLRERFDCRHWDLVRDCFCTVKGAYIVTQPAAGRRYFTLCPETVIQRLVEAGVW